MLGTLTYKGKAIYQFNEEDRELLIRALLGECGENAGSDREGLAVLVCMIQRWAMFLTLPWYQRLLLKNPEAKVYGYDEFNEMLAAYSQPVNPRWLDGGRFDRDPGNVDRQEARRASLLSKPIAEFPTPIIELVTDCIGSSGCKDPNKLITGVPEDMRGLVHFFLPAYYYARKLKKSFSKLTDDEVLNCSVAGYGASDPKKLIFSQPKSVSLRSNVFYRNTRTKNWRADFVKVVPATLAP